MARSDARHGKARGMNSWMTVAAAGAMLLIFAATSQAQTLTVLHDFTGGADGSGPIAGLTPDSAGNYYGIAAVGGTGQCNVGNEGCGAAFKLTHHGSSWVLNPIYEFTSVNNGPFNPQSRLVFGPDGSLYGTTLDGSYFGCQSCGAVFKLQPPASFCRSFTCSWTLTVLHTFTGGSDGEYPYSDLAFDAAGNIYGTTWGGGLTSCAIGNLPDSCGTVFKLTHNADGTWSESILWAFQDGPDGGRPYAGVVIDRAGSLYGVTSEGGTTGCGYNAGCGVVYRLSPSASGWTLTTLYAFSGGADGASPYGGLIFDSAGNLYGTTQSGGAGMGTVFELTPAQGGWSFQTIYTFTGTQAELPESTLTLDSAGNLYGTSLLGGRNGFGTVYKLTPSGSGWSYASLHDFDLVGSDGGELQGSVAVDAGGNVFGTAAGPYDGTGQGLVFEIAP